MKSRRDVLRGFGTAGLAGLAGCSELLSKDETGDKYVSVQPDIIDPIVWSETIYPVTVPATLADAHRERARELLASVPVKPSIPNSAVAEELRENRRSAADDLAEDIEEPLTIDILSRWRYERYRAAKAWGAYRAATGGDDTVLVTESRKTLHRDIRSFLADHEYRASSPLEAVLAHAPIDDLFSGAPGLSNSAQWYPDDPVAHPFQAGRTVGRIERARARLSDSNRLRETYLSEQSDASPQLTTLVEASNRLHLAVAQKYRTVAPFLDADQQPFDTDLQGTLAFELWRRTRRMTNRIVDDPRDSSTQGEHQLPGDYAFSVVLAGQRLAALDTVQTVIDGIRDGSYQNAVTVDSVTRTGQRARAEMTAIEQSEHRRLAMWIARPALREFQDLTKRNDERYARNLQSKFAWIELYARTVPAATAFVLDRVI